MSPELPTPQEQKLIDQMVEADIDFAVEQTHIHEIVKDDESEDDSLCISPSEKSQNG